LEPDDGLTLAPKKVFDEFGKERVQRPDRVGVNAGGRGYPEVAEKNWENGDAGRKWAWPIH
jgi:hypothetical protein